MRHISLTRSAVGIGIAVIGLAAIALPTAASAAELDAIDSVTIVSPDPTDPSAPLTVGDEFTLDAEWSVADDAQPGDTFGLTFPSPISVAWTQNFDLLDPDGLVIGSCVASGQSIDCTLGDYVLDHDDVHGSLNVRATAVEATESEELTFETSGGTTVTAPIPGGGIVDSGPSTGPEQIRKYGGMTSDGSSARWAIEVPIEHLEALGEGVVLTDTYDERLTLDPSTVSVAYVAPDGWDAWIADGTAESLPLASGEWTFTDHPTTHSFDLTFPTPRADGGWYLVSYSTPLPADAETGDVFGNSVSASGTKLAESTVTYSDAGGNGSGSRERSLAVTKAVAGSGTIPDTSFVVRASCVKADGSAVSDYPVDKSIRAGEKVTFEKLPVGATCTVSEPSSGGADSVRFSPSPVVEITAASPTVIELTVTNTFDVEPTPSPTPPAPTVEPTTEPTPGPAAPTTPPSDDLAVTGSADPSIVIGGAAALLAIGLATALVARRRATR
ncbi:hypothetical protein CLV49_2661 [Labedella gwakjiensis]|uniref:Uncharacterized protein n=1 Tax=Labedella gwakjiensis TaxID=390269 RepID=A0A2P8GYI2_9MICO|nr:DUF5979 domain-containing protein [Labedella gwakjiensis]PSL39029.1 hypothetical protein CLV49_2661 [Labedella gwakjiensis]RUQ86520.1 hypothetical protein ELQ93_05920 [Labedella gwakjiensis]